MTAPTGPAVFLSYASQDAAVVERIAADLRAAGVEVWFDRDELVGGDAWDAKIRRQITECALFVPVISASTQARLEGYFRLEWKLAAQRTHAMAEEKAFLLPVVIDDTADAEAKVPAEFKAVQWTRLPGGKNSEKFCGRVRRLLGPAPAESDPNANRVSAQPPGRPPDRPSPRGWLLPAIIGGVVVAVAGLFLLRPRRSPKEIARLVETAKEAATKAPAARPAARPDPSPATRLSPARQLAAKARAMIDALDSTPDDYAAAEGLLKRALELEQNDGEIWAISSRLNSMYMSRAFDTTDARREPARSQAERAFKLAPDSVEVLLAIARAQRRTDPPRAEAALRKALGLAPQDGRLLLNLGSLYRVQNRLEEAMALYEQAAASPDVMPLARYDQFLVCFYQRRFADADRYVREAAAALPSVNFVTGQAMIELTWRGQPEAALRILAAAPSQVQNEPRAMIVTVLAAQMNRQPEQALAALRRFPADFVSDAWYTGPKALLVGLCEAQANRAEAARVAWEAGLAHLRKRLQEAPNGIDEHLRLGELLAWSGQTEAALREANIYTQLTSGRRQDWVFSAARIYAALGRADEAVPLLAAELAAPPSGRWPLTPTLLRLDPLWDKLRGDARFQALTVEAPAGEKPAAATPKADEKSVAVLAFANLSDDKANEYFSDGVSEELLNVLAKVPGLKVSARTSAFFFKGKEVPIPEIAKQLGVAYVVEGSVRKAGDKVRVTAQLIKAADGFHVWSDTFTRDLKDIFAVQDEIAGLIAQNLKLSIGLLAPGPRRVVNPEAHQFVLEGRHFWNQRTFDGLARAEAAFTQARQVDPQFAQAYAGLADVRWVRTVYASYAGNNYVPEKSGNSGEAAMRAIDLDPTLAEAYPAAGGALHWAGRLREAETIFRKAITLNPNYALGHHWYALTLEAQGRLDEALSEIEQAILLDPLSATAHATRHRFLLMAGRISAALAADEKAQALRPGFFFSTGLQAQALLAAGRHDEALAVARAIVAHPGLEFRYVSDASAIYVLRTLGRDAEAVAHVENLLPLLPADSFMRGLLLVALDRWEEATPFLGRTPLGMREIFFWNPIWDRWRDDPRFGRLLDQLNCTEEYQVARATLARMRARAEAKQ